MVTVIKSSDSLDKIRKIIQAVDDKSGVDTEKYCGTIKLKKDPVIIQKELRDEWK
jgi:hypothetical protein